MPLNDRESIERGWSLPLAVGAIGSALWIVGELADIAVGGSPATAAVAGAGIVLVSVLPFELMDRQGRAWRSVSYIGAFLLTVGAFLIGAKNILLILSTSPEASMMQSVQQNPLDALAGFAYLGGAALFTAGLLGNGFFPRWQSALILATAILVAVVVALEAPQGYASAANIALATVFISMIVRAARHKSQVQ